VTISKLPVLLFLFILLLFGCHQLKESDSTAVIANGKMPNCVLDDSGIIHLVYGRGDSLLYSFSSDGGNKFSSPEIIAIIHGLTAAAMRGPQIASADQGLVVTANNHAGDIFGFRRGKDLHWMASGKVNDADTIAKENLMALGADKGLTFAIWLDLREGHNAIYGSTSKDGGRSWSKNMLVYRSPDSTVCECCKPSVVVKENSIYVMFRNWLAGNRDLYLIRSDNGGISFGAAVKLGSGSWPLNGCPMDGGFLSLDAKGKVQTVWMREGKIYACESGEPEFAIGEGRHCTIETVRTGNVYAWINQRHVILSNSKNEKLDLGPGDMPMIKSIKDDKIICIWTNGEVIQRRLVKI
jgi:hypothetical protein